jgi:hypothetical protein
MKGTHAKEQADTFNVMCHSSVKSTVSRGGGSTPAMVKILRWMRSRLRVPASSGENQVGVSMYGHP